MVIFHVTLLLFVKIVDGSYQFNIQAGISAYINKLVDQHALRTHSPYLNRKKDLLIMKIILKQKIKSALKESLLTANLITSY